ncbi:MAG: cytochrome c oxidase subunit 3 [Salibacteraceae bacterium]
MESIAFDKEERYQVKLKTSKGLLWVGMASIVMVFIGLTSAYIVRQEEGQWLVFDLPMMFGLSTLFILLSSATMVWAVRSAKANNNNGVKTGLLLTLLLGVMFAISQFMAWQELVEMGVFFAGKESNASGSYLYVISGLHLAHLVVGILSLIYTFARSTQRAYNSERKLGLEVCALYWHFLDALWVYLFLFLFYIR